VSDVNMVLVGDTFVGRPDPDSAFATARHLLKDVDIAFCNLETVVADVKYLDNYDHCHQGGLRTKSGHHSDTSASPSKPHARQTLQVSV
jgi:hypothetical protein